jgi:hypothetical protein
LTVAFFTGAFFLAVAFLAGAFPVLVFRGMAIVPYS